jgi:hypothetical protein
MKEGISNGFILAVVVVHNMEVLFCLLCITNCMLGLMYASLYEHARHTKRKHHNVNSYVGGFQDLVI